MPVHYGIGSCNTWDDEFGAGAGMNNCLYVVTMTHRIVWGNRVKGLLGRLISTALLLPALASCVKQGIKYAILDMLK